MTYITIGICMYLLWQLAAWHEDGWFFKPGIPVIFIVAWPLCLAFLIWNVTEELTIKWKQKRNK